MIDYAMVMAVSNAIAEVTTANDTRGLVIEYNVGTHDVLQKVNEEFFFRSGVPSEGGEHEFEDVSEVDVMTPAGIRWRFVSDEDNI